LIGAGVGCVTDLDVRKQISRDQTTAALRTLGLTKVAERQHKSLTNNEERTSTCLK
jgi:hypothetical protein